MALKKYSDEQIAKLSMIEVANQILTEKKEALNFIDLFKLVAEYKHFTMKEQDDLLARFYTDLNVDGRFTTLGTNLWGLKRWYPVDQTSEKSLAEARKRELEDEELEEEEEELELVVDEYDVIDNYDEDDDGKDDIKEEFEGFQIDEGYDDN